MIDGVAAGWIQDKDQLHVYREMRRDGSTDRLRASSRPLLRGQARCCILCLDLTRTTEENRFVSVDALQHLG
jgi:hypothetical protein